MAYDATKPVTGGSLVAADIRENFRALKEDAIVSAAAVPDLAITTAKINDLAVTAGKLGALAVETAKINTGAVTQTKLATSQGSVNSADGNVTLPGGEYGFYPQTKSASLPGSAQIASSLTTASYITNIYLVGTTAVYAQQRYVTSSGEIFWLFILKDKLTGDTLSMWQAPDHPCFGNGGKPNLLQHPFSDVKDNRWFGSKEVEIIIVNPSHNMVQEAMFKRIAIEGGYPDSLLYQSYINKAKDASWKGAMRLYQAQKHLGSVSEAKAREFLLDYQGFIIDETRSNRDLLEVFNDEFKLDKEDVWEKDGVAKVCTVALPDEDLHGSAIIDWRMMPIGTAIEPIKTKIPQPQDTKFMTIKEK